MEEENMKKKIALVLSLVMLMSMTLTACNGGEKDNGPNVKTKDTKTVAVGAVIIARDDVPEEDIYTFVSTIFENKDALAEQHGKGNELDLDFAASVTSVPYHPGAARYFAEKDKTVASVKDGAGTGTSKALTFGTGGDTGTYYGFGGVLASYVSNNTGVSVTAVTSGGSQNNIEELAAGNVQLGFVQSDVMSYAYNGERLFDTKVEGFSVVAALYMEQVQIITLNSSIKSVADLKGKNVSIGDLGSGVYFNAIDVLSAYGLTEDDIKPVYQSFGNSVDSLKDKKIDAAFVVAGAPTTAVVDLVSTNTTYMVELGEEETKALLDASPYYSAYTIKAGTY
jgi:TRAP transporter TAXI family solute receptor